MAREVVEVVPGLVSQAEWDAKFGTTTEKLKDMGGAQTTDDLTEGAVAKYDTGVPPATQDDLPDGSTAKQFSATEQTKLTGVEEGADVNPADLAALDPTANTKLGGIEDSATADQTGLEIQTAVEGIADADKKIVLSEPQTGEHKIYGIHRNAAGNPEYDYEDQAEA